MMQEVRGPQGTNDTTECRDHTCEGTRRRQNHRNLEDGVLAWIGSKDVIGSKEGLLKIVYSKFEEINIWMFTK